MSKTSKNNTNMGWVTFGVLFVVVICIVQAFILGSRANAIEMDRAVDLSEYWTEDEEDGTRKGTSWSCIIPEEADSTDTLAIRNAYQYISVSLDGEELFRTTESPTDRTFAPHWEFVELPENSQGKKLTVVTYSPGIFYNGRINESFIGSESEVQLRIVTREWPWLLISMLSFLIGVISLIYIFTAERKAHGDWKTLDLAVTAICASIWGYADSRLWQFITPYPALIHDLGFLAPYLFMFFLTRYMTKTLGARYRRANWILQNLMVAAFVIFGFLQFLNILDFMHEIPVVYVLIVDLAVALIVEIAKLPNSRERAEYYPLGFAIVIQLVLTFWDIILYFAGGSHYGILSYVGILIMLAIFLAFEIRESLAVVEKKREERNFRALATTDPITGCGNRVAFSEMEEEVRRTAAKAGSTYILAQFEMPGYVEHVRKYGHAAGDELAVNCAKQLRRHFADRARICRVSDEQVAALLLNSSQEECEKRFEAVKRDLFKIAGGDAADYMMYVSFRQFRPTL